MHIAFQICTFMGEITSSHNIILCLLYQEITLNINFIYAVPNPTIGAQPTNKNKEILLWLSHTCITKKETLNIYQSRSCNHNFYVFFLTLHIYTFTLYTPINIRTFYLYTHNIRHNLYMYRYDSYLLFSYVFICIFVVRFLVKFWKNINFVFTGSETSDGTTPATTALKCIENCF